jgi:hypothetical protein
MFEDAFQNFSLLLELPDTYQELAVQTLYYDFHCFPELPLELRLHIWRCIFPNPRDVRLCYEDKEPLLSAAVLLFPPITSRINTESRDETWLYYHMLWPHKDSPWYESRNQRLCIDPKRDFIYFCLQLCWPKYSLYWAVEQHPEFLTKVQHLRMYQGHVRPENEELDLGELGRRFLPSFTGLKSLTLHRWFQPHLPHWVPLNSPLRPIYDKYRQENEERARMALKKFFLKGYMVSSDGTMPVIIVQDGKQSEIWDEPPDWLG